MLAGASAVGVGYAAFRNPSALTAIIDDLEKWCERKGIARLADLIGAMIDEPPADTMDAAARPL
jgi:dihydroorotate dehydrogenase (NAD+) catalytic subunit